MCAAHSLQLYLSLCDPMDYSPLDSYVRDSPGKNTGVSYHALLQEIFPIWGMNLHLPVSPALQADSLPTEPPGKPQEPQYIGAMIISVLLMKTWYSER